MKRRISWDAIHDIHAAAWICIMEKTLEFLRVFAEEVAIPTIAWSLYNS